MFSRRARAGRQRGCIVVERRFKSTVRSDCFREEGGLTKEGDEERRSGVAILPPSLLRRNPLYLSLNTYFEVVSRRDYGSGHGRGRDGTPPLRGSENVPLSRDERAAEVRAGPNGL